jgi:prepilin-type N-terminal cleavage/methylation domain-containing protein
MEYFHENPLKNDGSNNAGYTIIEVLVAVAIFSIGIMAVASLQNSSFMANSRIREKTEAWAILDQRAESLRLMPFCIKDDDGIDNDGDSLIDEPDEGTFQPVAGDYSENSQNGRFTIHWQVVDDYPIPGDGSKLNVPGDANLPNLPPGDYTVSKTISVQVTRAGGDPDTDALAMVEFVKTWAVQGIQ